MFRLLIICCCISIAATAQQPQLAFTHLTVEQGLSQNAALCITQDKTGFTWIGTKQGLNRFDGHRVAIYKHDPTDSNSLSSAYILSLLCDSRGDLWIGTTNGLNRYNVVTDRFEHVFAAPGRLSSNSVSAIYEDKKGNIWFGTAAGLNLLVNRDKMQCRAFFHQLPQLFRINAICQDVAGNLWLATASGLAKTRVGQQVELIQLYKHNQSDAGSIAADYITTILEDGRQNLWAGTQHNGLELLQQNGSFIHFTHTDAPHSIINNNIRKLTLDKQGNIWVATQEGLSILDPQTKNCTSYQHDPGDAGSLSQNSIHSIFKDANNTMWVGSFFGGVNIAYVNPFKLYQNSKSPASISNNVVSSMAEDAAHNLWIGTEGGGLNFFNGQTQTFTAYKNIPGDSSSLPGNLVKAVHINQAGQIWLGVSGSWLCRFDPAAKQCRQVLNIQQRNPKARNYTEVIAFETDHNGILWTGSMNGVTWLDTRSATLPAQTQPAPFLTVNQNVRYLFEDSRKNLWIATAAGLWIWRIGQQRLDSVTVKQDGKTILQNLFVNCVMQDAQGNIWVGTQNGLGRYDAPHSTIRLVNEQLAAKDVLGILEDHLGHLWLSTDNGLVQYDVAKNTCRNFTMPDGLAGNQFNYNSFLKESNGRFLFGGYNGISGFYPAMLDNNDRPAALVFTGLKLFGKPVVLNGSDELLEENITIKKDISFNYDQNVFTLEFALLNYIKAAKNNFAYKLDGFDKGWNYTSTPSAAYTNLSPGNYVFWVKGANNDGVWSTPVSMAIEVRPPFWRTWWAYAVYALLAAALLFFIIRYFVLRELLKKEDELHQVKLNFFTNISHEIRTHLTLIMAPVDNLLEAKKDDAVVLQQLQPVKTNAGRLLSLVNELMDFRKAETSNLQLKLQLQNLVPFVETIAATFNEIAASRNIKYELHAELQDLPVYFDERQLQKVLFNLITNAFKFTPDGGHIIVDVFEEKENAAIAVTDNGRGIAPEYIGKLFNNFFQVADHGVQNTGYGIGLALSKNIVELHKGSLLVESKPGNTAQPGKTVFTVLLKKGNKTVSETETATAAGAIPAAATATPQTMLQGGGNDLPTAAKPYTLLIAEDNPELRALVVDTLGAACEIMAVENGLLAWDAATAHIPDLVISDVMMPEMDGYTLCHKLKTDARTSHIPVVLLTAKSAEDDQLSGFETGADIYITKPFSSKLLQLQVRNLLALHQNMREQYGRRLSMMPVANSDSLPAEPAPAPPPELHPLDEAFIQQLIAITDEFMDDPGFGVEMLSRKVAMSAPVLYKKLKAIANLSVNDFIKAQKMKKAAALLLEKRHTVYEIAYMVGFGDRKYFSREFKKQFGKTPTEFAGGSDSNE